MSLFDLNQKQHQPDQDGGVVNASDSLGSVFNGASIKYFKSKLDPLHQNMHYHFWTGGQWSMHTLAAYVLSITGPADVWLSTWAMTEEPVRAYIDLMKHGYVKSLKCIFDYKIKEQKSKAFLLAETNFTSVKLAHCHAKVMVISNDTWGISIPSSANQTRNPRIEYGIVCTDSKIADENIKYMEAIISGEKIFSVRPK